MEKRKRIYLVYLKFIAKKLLCQLSEKSDKSVSLIIFNILTPLSSQRCFLLTAFVKASQALSGKSKIFLQKQDLTSCISYRSVSSPFQIRCKSVVNPIYLPSLKGR